MKNTSDALRKNFITLLLLFFISSAFFISLYNLDNKYTHKSTQAASGLLFVSEEDLAAYPLRFLIRGWAFYPNTLLSPDTLERGRDILYMTYCDIGESSAFRSTSDSPYGSATYVMHLQLPKQSHTYSLQLPEIFSAYRLYVNDRLLAETGNAVHQTYKDRIHNRVITFEASGTVTLMIAVTNYSHYYSGIIYPPAFGTADAVNDFCSRRLFINGCILMLCLLTACISLYAYICLNQQKALLYSLLCIMVCLSCTYYTFHTLFEVSIFPWYTLEILAGSVMIYLVVCLHNDFCSIHGKLNTISRFLSMGVCFLTLLHGISSFHLTSSLITMYSHLIPLYKLSIAVYLLITAFFTSASSDKSKILFYSEILFGSALFWEQVFPFYDPCLTQRISEWGSLFMVLGIGYMICYNTLRSYSHTFVLAEEQYQNRRQLAMQVEYSRQLSVKGEENRKIIHDFRQHLRTLQKLGEAGNLTALNKYLHEISNMADSSVGKLKHFSNNTTVDATLSYYYYLAEQKEISAAFQLSLPHSLPISDVELCAVLGNLLENAVEACERQSHPPRTITLKQKQTEDTLFLLIENSYSGVYVKEGTHFRSLKSSQKRMGIGLTSVNTILHKYGGTLDIYPESTVFRVGITLPLPHKNDSAVETEN